ncbi:hypothetical protein B0O44_11112 [Pedobacter nutrimenti]|uniref:Uncharacterized protein n=1 Tax=Pedobacter nutrimenti TaxID=1241337 RepID=A0A318UDP9_9SPHI|nr:hypothetical protein B0O44_11112 [Pedobacter nutrimenti]
MMAYQKCLFVKLFENQKAKFVLTVVLMIIFYVKFQVQTNG